MEIELIKLMQKLSSTFFDIFFELISYFSNYAGLIILFLILFIFINKKYSLFFAATYIIGIGFNYLFKGLFDRQRPYEVDSEIINKLVASGKSFPSGHTVSAVIICSFILYYIFKNSASKTTKIISTILSIIFIILVGISRMYLGQHYLTDIFAGIIIGLIFAFIGILCYNKIERGKNEHKSNNKQKRKQ